MSLTVGIVAALDMGTKRTFDSGSDSDSAAEEEKPSSNRKTANNEVASSSSKKSKPLPPNYVCKICGAKDEHAVYECPNKIKNFGKSKASSENSTFEIVKSSEPVEKHASDDTAEHSSNMSVYVSGLPYDIKRESLVAFFVEHGCSATGLDAKRDVKLVMFDDNANKCKGIAFVKFHDEEQLQTCLEINGTKFGKKSVTIERVVSRPKPTKVDNARHIEREKKSGPKGCFRCGMLHDPLTCSNPRICYRCKSTEHISSQCPFKKQKV